MTPMTEQQIRDWLADPSEFWDARNVRTRPQIMPGLRAMAADYLIPFRKKGKNPVPVTHPTGLDRYAGEEGPPAHLLRYRNWKGKQTENKYSHWIWRRYASSCWTDIRLSRVLPFQDTKAPDDVRHVHPLQLDVIERAVTLWSNPGETVLTPFMGVGSEVYGAVQLGRRGVGVELKPAYYRQAVLNLAAAAKGGPETVQEDLFAGVGAED